MTNLHQTPFKLSSQPDGTGKVGTLYQLYPDGKRNLWTATVYSDYQAPSDTTDKVSKLLRDSQAMLQALALVVRQAQDAGVRLHELEHAQAFLTRHATFLEPVSDPDDVQHDDPAPKRWPAIDAHRRSKSTDDFDLEADVARRNEDNGDNE